MSIESNARAKISSSNPIEEEREIGELEFDEDKVEETSGILLPVAQLGAAKEEVSAEAESKFSLPSIFKESGLDITLKLLPAQAEAQSELWLGLRSGRHLPLLRVLDRLDLGQLVTQLASLVEEYAYQIEAAKAVSTLAASKVKAKAKVVETSPKLVGSSEGKPVVTTPPSVKSAEPNLTNQTGKEKDKPLAQLSFF